MSTIGARRQGRDDGRVILLHRLLGAPPYGPQVHGHGAHSVEVVRGDVAGARGAGLTGEDLQAYPAAAVARCPVPTPEAGADGVVQGKAVDMQLSGDAGE